MIYAALVEICVLKIGEFGNGIFEMARNGIERTGMVEIIYIWLLMEFGHCFIELCVCICGWGGGGGS